MARSQKDNSLRRISVETTIEAEEAVMELMAGIFGTVASAYVNEETKVCTISVYLDGKPRWTLALRRELDVGLRAIGEAGLRIGPASVTARKLRRENWAESWKRHFKPMEIGSSLLVKPSWSKVKARRGQAEVILDPGLSFGTGQHATTSFCLNQIVAARRVGERQTFLDIGTGSGILAIAAAKLGYKPVVAFDFDKEAVRVARENARNNKASIRLSHQDLTELPLRSGEKFDLVCANLIFDLLLEQKERILNRLAPNGTLVLAGILITQFARVQKAYESAGMRLVAERCEREWQSGAFVRKQ